jgi:hypothetical protein
LRKGAPLWQPNSVILWILYAYFKHIISILLSSYMHIMYVFDNFFKEDVMRERTNGTPQMSWTCRGRVHTRMEFPWILIICL